MDTSDFANQYRSLSDEQLSAINEADLNPQAQMAYEAELQRRATPEYREQERVRLDRIQKEAATKIQKMQASNWFLKPRSASWKLAASVIWLAINWAAAQFLASAGRGMAESQFLHFSAGIFRVFIFVAGVGWYFILSRPRAKPNQR